MHANVEAAILTLQHEGKARSTRNVNRVLRRTPPRYMGMSFRDLLPLLQYWHLSAEAQQAIAALHALTQQAEALVASGGGGRDHLLIRGETCSQHVAQLRQQALDAGQPVRPYDDVMRQWQQASVKLIWGKAGRPWEL
jgi:hypothetical protein